MKKILSILFIALCANAEVEEKKIIGNIIPPNPEYQWIEETMEGKVSEQWEISDDIITSIQPILLKYLKDKGDKWSRFEKEVYNNLDAYRCQYYGLVINGNHQIFCNFFLMAECYEDWKEDDYPIGYSVSGGGLEYFRFVYDINEGTCKAFMFNGP